MRIGFDNAKYLELQSQHILKRIQQFGNKLYLEFGGKLFDDYHASRVLPGFHPDSKLQMLLQLKDQAEIIIAINANDIERNKIRGDLGITYDSDVLRLIDQFRSVGLYVGSVVLTRYTGQRSAAAFQAKLEKQGIPVYHHYPIEGYPLQVDKIVCDEGLGKNEYIKTTRPLVVVTAPGPGSGKMATCLSQIYHENKHGVKAGYAKFETFPIWNLPLKHPVNIAYEAATADLDDVNMIDSYHLEAHNVMAVNYNRDIDIYPVLRKTFERIFGDCPYSSPTDMGVNMAGYCICDNDVVCDAAKQEVMRRYYQGLVDLKLGNANESVVSKLQLLLEELGIDTSFRKVIQAAEEVESRTDEPGAAIELVDGKIVVGRTSNLMGACAGVIINALKHLAGIPETQDILSSSVMTPIQELKTHNFGSKNPRLHSDEVLYTLAICAATEELPRRALAQLDNLKGCEAHCTVITTRTDTKVFKKLGMHLTCNPKYQVEKLFNS